MEQAILSLDDVAIFGDRFARPECVLATRAGDIFAADQRGGVTHVLPNGEWKLYVGGTLDLSGPLHPNGIALDRDGSFIVAHLGNNDGGVYRLHRDGRLVPILQHFEGADLTSTNFVMLDHDGRIWVTVCTRHKPRADAFKRGANDGYIVLIDENGPRIVADGINFANECRMHPSGRWMYVNETYARQLTRFAIGPDGILSGREVVATLGPGEFPDGLVFDEEGGAWLTCIIANRVIRIAPDGSRQLMLDESNAEHIAEVEESYRVGAVPRPKIDNIRAKILANVSSLAFGGPDLRTGYFGVLLTNRMPTMRLPYAGAKLAHWDWR